MIKGKLAQSFDDYANDLHTAQSGMTRAKEIAHQGGLTVNGDVIEHPGPAPDVPKPLPADGSASPEQTQAHNQAVQAGHDHQRKVRAYNQARDEADRAHRIRNRGKNVAERVWDGLSGKKYLNATMFTNGAAGRLINMQRNALKVKRTRCRPRQPRPRNIT